MMYIYVKKITKVMILIEGYKKGMIYKLSM